MKKAKPTVSSQLVAKALADKLKSRKSWFEILPESQRSEITEAARQWPETGQPWTCLARVVKEQFGLQVSVRMICDALRKAGQE